MRKDPVSHVLFLDEAMKVSALIKAIVSPFNCPRLQVLENKPSAIFWGALGRSLEKQARDAAKGICHTIIIR